VGGVSEETQQLVIVHYTPSHTKKPFSIGLVGLKVNWAKLDWKSIKKHWLLAKI
jgi:hypothetical protein